MSKDGRVPARIRIPALAGVLAGLAVAAGLVLSTVGALGADREEEWRGLVRAAVALGPEATEAELKRLERRGPLQLAGRLVPGAARGDALDPLGADCIEHPVPAGARATGPVTIGGREWLGACVPAGGGAVVVADLARRHSRALLRRALGLALVIGSLSAALVIASVRRLVNPVATISEAARRLARGERGVRLPEPEEPELSPLTQAINQLAAAAEEREDEVLERLELTRQIGALVAHEVRNPLHSLALLADLACHEEAPDRRRETLEAIRRELGLIEEVVRRLVHSADGGELHLVRRDTDLVALVERTFQLHGPRARELGVRLERVGLERAPIRADPALLRRALENLVQNALEIRGEARQRGGAGGLVRVSVEGVEGGWQIGVEDDGDGVPEDLREQIFQPGVSRRSGGTGLGLHLARLVARAHGGALRCGDSPLGGARFTLSLPSGGS